MGGSSAPPQEIWNKFHKPTKEAGSVEQQAALQQMRERIRYCQVCVDLWSQAPEFNRQELRRVIEWLERRIDAQADPRLAVEWQTLIGDPVGRALEAVNDAGPRGEAPAEEIEFWLQRAWMGWKRAYSLYRQRERDA